MVKNDTKLEVTVGPAIVNTAVKNISNVFYSEDAKRVYHLVDCLYSGIEEVSCDFDGIFYSVKVIKNQ